MNASVVKSMFNHLVQSYSEEEARDILIGKYPDQEGEIVLLSRERQGVAEAADQDDMREVNQLVDAVRRKQATAAIKPAKAPKAAKVAKGPKVVKTVNPRGESKMQKARELFGAAKDQSRKAMIAVFVKELGLSPVAASTYFYNCKK